MKSKQLEIKLRPEEAEALQELCYNKLFNNGFRIDSAFLGNVNSALKKLEVKVEGDMMA